MTSHKHLIEVDYSRVHTGFKRPCNIEKVWPNAANYCHFGCPRHHDISCGRAIDSVYSALTLGDILQTEIIRPVVAPIAPDTTETLNPVSYYALALKSKLPQEIFKPYLPRLIWVAGYTIVAAISLILISNFPLQQLPQPYVWAIKFALAIVVGNCFGAFGFFAHEVMHGSVVKSRALQDRLAFFAFMPWFISPTFWRTWHNQLHHGNTQALITDPDAFPILRLFKHSKFMQYMYPYTPGSGHKRSYLYFFFWFSFHVLVAQFYLRFRNSLYDRMNHKKVTIEMCAQVAIWLGALYLLGFENILFTFFIPFFVQNYFAMSYIATNHNLSPLTKINDPLVNSLTVTNLPILEKLHFNFGYHVEHHLYPQVNGHHAKKIHNLLKQEYADKFLVMTKFEAMSLLYKTARIYKNSTTLINPETGATYPTIKI
jgi:fatty acid desaturase